MTVDSYLEIFTTLFGWRFYEIVWDVLAATGLVYVPFIAILVSHWKAAAGTGDYRSAWSIALRNVELDFYLALFVAMISGPPALTLSASTLSYTPRPTLIDPSPATATVASPQSSYGGPGAFQPPGGNVRIPLWWYAVLTLSKGLNHAILAGFPAERGLREVRQQARLATIPDARLREEAGRFLDECFVTARAKYLREKPDTPTVRNLLSTYGSDDVEWMGSHVFRTLYYPRMRARRPVRGWPYDPSRDVDYDPAGIHAWGQPTCEQWWADPTRGLRARISDIPTTATLENKLIALASGLPALTGVPALAAASEKAKDWAVRAALDNARVDVMTAYQPDDLGANRSKGTIDAVYNALANIAGAVGMGVMHFETTAKSNILKMGLPMAQAILLMAVYAILPFVVVLSRYSLGVMLGVSIALFSIHFWTVLWRFAAWVDENLLQAMFPGTLDNLLYSLASPEGVASNMSKDLFFDMLLMALLVGMPLVWTVVLGWAGISVAGRINDLAGAASPVEAHSAPSKGRTITSKIVGKTATKK